MVRPKVFGMLKLNQMRVLWFTNTPSLSKQVLTGDVNYQGGWIDALDKALNQYDEIELGIAFHWQVEEMQEIEVGNHNTRYFAIQPRPRNKWKRWWNRLSIQTTPTESLEDYYKVIQEFQPDVIHFFGSEGPFAMTIPNIDIPALLWFQGNLTTYEKKWEASISLREISKHEKLKTWINGQSNWHDFHLYQKMAIRERMIFKSLKYITGRTEWDKRVSKILAPQAQYFHCEEAMRPAFFKHQWKPRTNQNEYRIVTIIKANLYKGLDSIFEAAKFLQAHLEKPLVWEVVGVKEDTAYTRVCRSKTNFPKSNSSVQVVGFKTAEQIVEMMLEADQSIERKAYWYKAEIIMPWQVPS